MADNDIKNEFEYLRIIYIFIWNWSHGVLSFFLFDQMQEKSNEKIYKFYTCQKRKKLIQIKFILYYVLGLKEVIRR